MQNLDSLNTPEIQDTNLLTSLYESLTCPITGDIMVDPVSGNDSSTYEKSAIVEWLQYKNVSPITKQPMTLNDLKVNANIRYLCDKYHAGELGNKKVKKNNPLISSNDINLKNNNIIKIVKGNVVSMISFEVDEATLPKTETKYLPQDLIIVIDHSGSMRGNVEAQDVNGNKLEYGFSIQDIVNHAAKTVIGTIDKDSRISIITFDNIIEVRLELTNMTDINKTNALQIITNIVPRGQTNIYGALEKAIEILDDRKDKSRNGSIILFTDGYPNIEPARGTADTIRKLRTKKNFTSPIHTMGFGYNLQQKLLYEIAKSSNGCNGHIPDGGLIATVFCNLLGNIMCTVVLNLQLHIITPDVEVLGDFECNYNSDKKTKIFDLGTVQIGQSRNIILDLSKISNADTLNIQYYYTYKICGISYTSEMITINNTNQDEMPNSDEILQVQYMRCKLVEGIRKMSNYNSIHQYPKSIEIFNVLKMELEELYKINTNPLIKGMKDNLIGDDKDEGQIKMAITNSNYYYRWGQFYLDQLSRALLLQVKPNFKDPAGVFGGDLFHDIVEKASDIFDSLPPPIPSNTKSYSSCNSNVRQPAVSMTLFNNPGGGCYVGSSFVTVATGVKKLISKICKNDIILTKENSNYNSKLIFTKVVCVIKTVYKEDINLVKIGNLKITPYHPIIFNNKWQFPIQCGEMYVSSEREVYTLVLESNHIAIVDNIPTICLGHNFNDNDIIKHSYFGTKKVINDLKIMKGFNKGLVEINPNNYIRDSNSVIGYKIEN